MNTFKLNTTSFLVLQFIFIVTLTLASPLNQDRYKRSQFHQQPATQQPEFLSSASVEPNVDSPSFSINLLKNDVSVDSTGTLQTKFQNSREFLEYFLLKDKKGLVDQLNKKDTPAKELDEALDKENLIKAYKKNGFSHYMLGDNAVFHLPDVVSKITETWADLRSSFEDDGNTPFTSYAGPSQNNENVYGGNEHTPFTTKSNPQPIDLSTGEVQRKPSPRKLGIFFPNDARIFPNKSFKTHERLINYLSHALTPYQKEVLAENNYKNLMYKLQSDRVFKHFPNGIPKEKFANAPDLYKALKDLWNSEKRNRN